MDMLPLCSSPGPHPNSGLTLSYLGLGPHFPSSLPVSGYSPPVHPHMPQCYPCLSPAHSLPMAPQHPGEKSQGLQPDIQAAPCSVPHWPLQLHISLLPKNHIPLLSLKDPHYDAPGPLHKLFFLPVTASSSSRPGMFLLTVQDFKHHFFIISLPRPPPFPTALAPAQYPLSLGSSLQPPVSPPLAGSTGSCTQKRPCLPLSCLQPSHGPPASASSAES